MDFISSCVLSVARKDAWPEVSLLDVIRGHIQTHGALSIADYMDLALQHPLYGYYRHGDRLGRSGDFITAPEVSQMFGEMIGLWLAEMWHQNGSHELFTLLELGPGRGTLIEDALRATQKIKGLHSAIQLHLVDTNQTFRAMQMEKLGNFNPIYVEDLAHLPKQPLYVVANEFFDALPIRQFVKQIDGWHERVVVMKGDVLNFATQPIDPNLLSLIPVNKPDAKEGMVIEISMPSLFIIRTLSKHIAHYGGAALIIDYGYRESSGKSTLQAVSGHKHAEILKNPGEVDLTAHVDYSALHIAAQSEGVVVHDVISQGEFLQMLGIELRAAQLKIKATTEQVADIDAALHRLTDVSEMGHLFKVLAVTQPATKAQRRHA